MDKYQITFETWNKVASLYEEKFMDLDLYNDSYDVFCKQIEKPNPTILEIGCGPGNITKYLLNKRPEFQIHAIDIAPNMISLAKINNPKASFEVMDCRKIDQLTGKFDAIICGFCLPYLSKADCTKFLKDCNVLLNDGGMLYFSTIEGVYQTSGYVSGSSGDKTYVYYYEEAYLKKELLKNEFQITKLIRKQYPQIDTSSQTHLIFIAKK